MRGGAQCTGSRNMEYNPRHAKHIFYKMAPAAGLPRACLLQLYTDGSTITEGTVGNSLRGKETTKSAGDIVSTDDGDTLYGIYRNQGTLYSLQAHFIPH